MEKLYEVLAKEYFLSNVEYKYNSEIFFKSSQSIADPSRFPKDKLIVLPRKISEKVFDVKFEISDKGLYKLISFEKDENNAYKINYLEDLIKVDFSNIHPKIEFFMIQKPTRENWDVLHERQRENYFNFASELYKLFSRNA